MYIVYLHIYFPPIGKSRFRVFTVFKHVSVETTYRGEGTGPFAKFAKFPEMEFLNGILSRDLESSQSQVLSGFLPSFFLSTK
jgi:hypothetical protein